MEVIEIRTRTKQYPVFIGDGAVKKIRPFLEERKHTRLLIISDANVAPLYLQGLEKELDGFTPLVFIAPGGEQAKSLETYYEAMTYGLEQGLDRKSLILALGGGAVGDLAGFVAATFMRGIGFIQIPTTILAHDSSVGGKTGINHHLGKNMIGSFHQPDAVFYDLSYFASLPPREVRSGFAELIKHALIGDPELYHWLLANVTDLKDISLSQYEMMLARGIKVKADIVSADEKEKGIRAYLNFGHTLGHAIEAEMGYGIFTHGEAVMAGMLFALNLSIKNGLEFDIDGFEAWVKGLGYNVRLPEGLEEGKLLDRMKKDKKAVGGIVRFVLLGRVGEPYLSDITDSSVKSMLKKLV